MGQTTPNMSIYIPSAGETNYEQSFASGMMNIDQHDHSGGPNKGVPISSSGLADFSVTFDKLNVNVAFIDTGIGTRGGAFQNQLQLLGYLANLYQRSIAPSPLGYVVMNGGVSEVRQIQDTATITFTGKDGTTDPAANLVVPVTVPNGGTQKTSFAVPNAPILAGTTGTGAFQQPASAGNVGEVYTSQGAGSPGIFSPLGGLGQIQYVNFTLTAAQIQNINTTSIQILPAQGAGKVIVPIFSYGLLNSSGTTFTLASGTTSIGFFYNDVANAMNFANSFLLSTTTDKYWWATQATNGFGVFKPDAQNTPLFVGIQGPPVAYMGGGTSTVDFTLAYVVISL